MTETLYRQVILDHYKNPQNFGEIEGADAHVHENNPLCGDELDIYLKFDEVGKVADAKFKGAGCAISVAAASLLTEQVKGQTKAELAKLTENDMLKLASIENISPSRRKCLNLAREALQKAVNHPQPPPA
jgi:nitrogen fixation protein NifU and related proteins